MLVACVSRMWKAIRRDGKCAVKLRVTIVPGSIKGTVVEVDNRGSLITDITQGQLAATPRDTSVRITVDEHETFGLFGPGHDQPSMTLVAVMEGDSDDARLKIELVDDSASAMLGVRPGAPVEILW